MTNKNAITMDGYVILEDGQHNPNLPLFPDRPAAIPMGLLAFVPSLKVA